MEKHKGFEPIYDKDSQILILGSFPSVKSREVGFYYGNKQNRFWTMLENVFNEKIEDSIEVKKDFLHRHHLALWDTFQESDLIGSADKSLEKSNTTTADFSFLLPPNTKVKKILCNGKTAHKTFTSTYKTDIPTFCLPSTSPANPRYDFNEWRKHLKE